MCQGAADGRGRVFSGADAGGAAVGDHVDVGGPGRRGGGRGRSQTDGEERGGECGGGGAGERLRAQGIMG